MLTVTLLVAAAVAVAVVKAREIEEMSTQAADDEAQLDALDPVTRAVVVTTLPSQWACQRSRVRA